MDRSRKARACDRLLLSCYLPRPHRRLRPGSSGLSRVHEKGRRASGKRNGRCKDSSKLAGKARQRRPLQAIAKGQSEMTTLRQRQTSSIILLLISLLLSCCAIALASQSKQEQVPAPPLPEDPTPLIELVTEAERASLAKAHEPKKAVEALLAIADAHLALALPAIQADDYKKSERELDSYRKAIGDAASTAFSSEEGKRKLAKKVEMKLHDHIRVLEQIDLRFPLEREAFAAAALDQAKHLRIKMLNER